MTAECRISLTAVLAAPLEQSEMRSQLLYGETCTVHRADKNFSLITAHYDGTEGWVVSSALQTIGGSTGKKTIREPFWLYNTAEGNILLSLGSEISDARTSAAQTTDIREEITATARQFLNVPYLYGGRSFFGTDAAGFIQLVYKVHGIALGRTAEQQAAAGRVIDFLGEAQAGDIAFFENTEGVITHCGIMLNASEIIHVAEQVRVDDLDSSGIYSRTAHQHTHRLRFLSNVTD